ncbi:alpha/beta fold hydrolase [Corynebacterium sp. CCM 9203]|uniref:alpha/beta fold hydrolase n=1 Tax=Corynebacterium sp. CCM 9203 TaxID=3057615 RepID=UPI0035243A36
MPSSPLARYTLPSRNNARTFISFHGITDSSVANSDLGHRMSSDFRVILPDARGHGMSPDFSAKQLLHPFDTLLEDALNLVKEEISRDTRRRPVVLHGHSMGGATAAAVARHHPELVAALILEDPALFTVEQRARFAATAEPRIRSSERACSEPEVVLGELRQVFPGWSVTDSAGWLFSQARAREAFLRMATVDSGEPRGLVLSALKVPTLLVTGDRDCLFGPEGLREVSHLGNRHLRTALVPGARHSVRRDDPEEFHAAVSGFLRDVVGDVQP